MTRTTTVLSYGMGVDSTAILIRWLADPSTRNFDLDDLIVVTAQTGSEYPETIELVNTYVLPRLRAAGVRFVELAKGGPVKADGVAVLQDTREPVALHPDGAYRLVDELTASGTVPQFGGTRKCSIKFKGEPIDAWLEEHLPTWRFTHVIGYESEEKGRAEKDSRLGALNKALGARRDPSYPLIDWGWNRARCLAYIESVTGVAEWKKSACTFCPFAEDRGIGRLSCDEAVLTMKLEAVCVALNPRQTLFTKKVKAGLPASALATYETAMPDAYEAFVTDICEGDWACYEVRRAWKGVGGGGKAGVGGTPARQLRILETGSAVRCHKVLGERAKLAGVEIATDEYGFRVLDLSPKPDFGNGIEHRIVVAPAAAVEKEGRGFKSLERQAA